MSTMKAVPAEAEEVEVSDKARRRKFTAQYKLDVLKRADALKDEPGQIGELLRKEGLYSSHLTVWRRLRDAGELSALEPKKRGPQPRVHDEREARIAELEAQVSQLQARAELAEALVEVQKKVSKLLGIELPTPDNGGKRR
jgi:transposase